METVVRHWIPLVVLVSLLFVARTDVQAHGGDASLIHACLQKNVGKVRIVGANDWCLPSEEPLDWSRGGAAVPAAPAYFFEVVDGKNEVVGPVVGLNGDEAVVGFKVGDLRFVLSTAGGFLFGSRPVYFKTAGCVPPGYVDAGFATLPNTGIGPVAGTLLRQVYLEDRNGPPELFSPVSAALGGWCFDWGGLASAAMAIPVLQIGPPPYSIR